MKSYELIVERQQPPCYKIDFAEFGNDSAEDASEDFGQPASRGNDIVDDPIYAEAIQFVLDNGKVSISLLQRRFRIGFNRAARFVEQMEKDGLIAFFAEEQKRKLYCITPLGRELLEMEIRRIERLYQNSKGESVHD